MAAALSSLWSLRHSNTAVFLNFVGQLFDTVTHPTSFYFVCEIEFFGIADGRVCAIFFLFTILFLFHDTEDKIATTLKENSGWICGGKICFNLNNTTSARRLSQRISLWFFSLWQFSALSPPLVLRFTCVVCRLGRLFVILIRIYISLSASCTQKKKMRNPFALISFPIIRISFLFLQNLLCGNI